MPNRRLTFAIGPGPAFDAPALGTLEQNRRPPDMPPFRLPPPNKPFILAALCLTLFIPAYSPLPGKFSSFSSTYLHCPLAQAKAAQGLLLLGDEASFAQWGSLGYPWAVRGQQPLIKTTGKRKAFKVFGLIEFFSGRLFYQGFQGKFNAQSYTRFLTTVLDQTPRPLFLVQDGAPYHRSAKVKQFFAQHTQRFTVFQLPSYSPDYNPIEFLWRTTKRQATHNQYFPEFTHLVASVEKALTLLASRPDYIRSLFTRCLQHMAQPLNLDFQALPLAA